MLLTNLLALIPKHLTLVKAEHDDSQAAIVDGDTPFTGNGNSELFHRPVDPTAPLDAGLHSCDPRQDGITYHSST